MLYAFISLHRDEILARCLRALKDEYPNRQDHELVEGISCFVDELIEGLARDSGIPEIATAGRVPSDATARRHGVIRRTQGFDLCQVVHDYGLACETVTQIASEYAE